MDVVKELAFEFITELLGFVPINYIDDIINALTDRIYMAVVSLENWIQQQIDLNKINMTDDEIEKGLASIETLFEKNTDKYFDRFELFVLRSIFSVPTSLLMSNNAKNGSVVDGNKDRIPESSVDNDLLLNEPQLRLPLYDVYYNNLTNNSEDDEIQLDKELEEMRRKILAAEYLRKNIELEIESIDKKNKELENFLLILSKLKRIRSKRRKSSILPSYEEDDHIENGIDYDENNENDLISDADNMNKKRKVILDDPRFDSSLKESITNKLTELYNDLLITKDLTDDIKNNYISNKLRNC